MPSPRRYVLASAATGLALLAGACGSSSKSDSGADSKPKTVNIGGFNFTESSILGAIYEGALRNAGYEVTVRPNMGNREVVAPALARGEIDLYPGYAASDLEFLDKGGGQASPDAQATTDRLRAALAPEGATALEPSPAVDTNAFAVTKATADKYNLKRLSDLAPIGDQLTLGGPPDCPTRPYCQPGLSATYGINFKGFRPLDAGGPLTVAALTGGDVDVALLRSTDASIAAEGLAVLEDDKHLQNADNVVPVIRNAAADAKARRTLDKVSAALTTADLAELTKRVDVDKEDPQVVAQNWLATHRL